MSYCFLRFLILYLLTPHLTSSGLPWAANFGTSLGVEGSIQAPAVSAQVSAASTVTMQAPVINNVIVLNDTDSSDSKDGTSVHEAEEIPYYVVTAGCKVGIFCHL